LPPLLQPYLLCVMQLERARSCTDAKEIYVFVLLSPNGYLVFVTLFQSVRH
jgi:hypothetical protein